MAKSQRKLNLRQLAFVTEYLKCGNATAAAKAAGYSPRTAGQQGLALLENPQIRAKVAGRERQLGMKAEDIRRRYEQIASQDIRKALSWGPDGVRITPSEELDEGTALAVSSVEESIDKRGKRTIKIRFHDPQKALDALAKFEGMAKDAGAGANFNVTNNLQLSIGAMSRPELEAALRVLEDPSLTALHRLLVPLLDSGQLAAQRLDPAKAVEEPAEDDSDTNE